VAPGSAWRRQPLIAASPTSRIPALCGRLPAVSPLTELDAFFTDHNACGDLDANVDAEVVWIICDCGASMARRADEGAALASND
jgi:hypothetical protein